MGEKKKKQTALSTKQPVSKHDLQYLRELADQQIISAFLNRKPSKQK